MGVSSIAPALPKMARVLDVSNEQIGLLITFFTLPGIFLTPILGIFADRFVRKTILVPSLFLFAIAGTACAFTSNFTWLLIFRFLQGIGGASLGALNVTLIGDLYQGNRRATAMGYNGSVLSIGTASYPAIGGGLALLGWHFPFYLTLLALPTGLLVLKVLKNPDPKNGKRIKAYLVELALTLKSRQVLGLFAANFLTFIMLYGAYLTFLPILLDENFGLSSFSVGIILSGASVVTGITSFQLGKLAHRFTESRLIVAASCIYIVVFAVIPFLQSLWLLILPIALFGFAQGINIPSVLNLLTKQTPTDYRAAFLSMNWTVIRSGQALGPLLLGMVYAATGLTGTFLFTAMLSILFLMVALMLIK